MTVIEVDFKVEKEDAGPKPLRMEHFYFPLGMWLVGILLSVFSFLAEIIIHRLGKSKTNIPNTTSPSVTQSSLLLHCSVLQIVLTDPMESGTY